MNLREFLILGVASENGWDEVEPDGGREMASEVVDMVLLGLALYRDEFGEKRLHEALHALQT